jgi:hypothetical protein
MDADELNRLLQRQKEHTYTYSSVDGAAHSLDEWIKANRSMTGDPDSLPAPAEKV